MFIEIAESHPRFLRKQLPEVVGAMLQVRRLAAFGVVVFCCVALRWSVGAVACASSCPRRWEPCCKWVGTEAALLAYPLSTRAEDSAS